MEEQNEDSIRGLFVSRDYKELEGLIFLGGFLREIMSGLYEPLLDILDSCEQANALVSGDRAQSFFRDISRSALSCIRTLDDLAMFAPKGKPERTEIDFNELAGKTLAIMDYQFRKEDIIVSFEPGDISPVWGCTFMLRQVMFLVLMNALEKLAGCKGQKRIRIITDEIDERVVVTVLHSPLAGEDEFRDDLFESPGMESLAAPGIGFRMVLSIMLEYGGTVSKVEKDGEWGISFSLPSLSAFREEHCASPGATGLAPARVLVVDDDRLVLDVLQNILQFMGFDVEVEVSPGNALDSIRAQKFDIVLVDYRMPEMPCRKFIDLACSLESCPRIAIITGDTTSVEVRSFAKEKNIPLIEKPFRVADMKELMNRLISR